MKSNLNFNKLLKKQIKEKINENLNNIQKSKTFKTKLKSNYEIVKTFSDITFEEYNDYVINQINNNDINTLLMFMPNYTRQEQFFKLFDSNLYENIQIEILERLFMHKGV